MAKRFTDTGKWDKAWFRRLGSKLRDVRQYVLDRCDHAGLIEIDLETFEHFLGESVSMDDIKKAFRNKVQIVDDKIFVPDFVEFQYKVSFETLNPSNKVHRSVLQRLESVGIKPLASPLHGDKDKDKDKDKDNRGSAEGEISSAEALASSVPVITQDRWSQKYPDAIWLRNEIESCFEFHSADPAQAPRTTGQWMRKLTSWLNRNWEERESLKKKNRKSHQPSDSFCGIAED